MASDDSPFDSDIDDQLSDAFIERTLKSSFEKTPHYFIPRGALHEIITKDSVCKAMNINSSTKEDDQLVDFVLTKARATFATAAGIHLKPKELKSVMTLFKEHNFGDHKLPIERWSSDKFKNNPTKGIWHPFASMDKPAKNGYGKIWTKARIWEFQKAQSTFRVPVFYTNQSNHDLGEFTVPFIGKRNLQTEGGAFGKVSQYEIHPDHIIDPSSPDGLSSYVFAVKEITGANEKDRQDVARHWVREVKALAKMNTLDSGDHIVRFITAFRRGDSELQEHYLIFEWADGGNLATLWESNPKPQLTAVLVKAVIEQLLGLTQALCAAHFLKDDGKYNGASYRHGDLKPANILRFLDGTPTGKLKIGDWGEAKSKHEVTAMRHSITTSQYGTRRYEPPEVTTGLKGMVQGQEENRLSRLYDIWSMGCVVLEFLVWLLYGTEGLRKLKRDMKGSLSDDPPFYQVSEVELFKTAWIHHVATYWMDWMAQDPACAVGVTALGDLLEIVQTCLLVVKLPRGGGTTVFDEPDQLHAQPAPTRPFKQPIQNTPNKLPGPGDSLAQDNSAVVDFAMNIVPPDPSEADMETHSIPAGPERIRADQLRDRLEHIRSELGESYWFTESESAIPKAVPKEPPTSDPKRLVQRRFDYGRDHTRFNLNHWSFGLDNHFASEVFSAFTDMHKSGVPNPPISSNLCNVCVIIRDTLWNPVFEIALEMGELETKARDGECDLCGLLWRTCERTSSTMFKKLRLERSGSTLIITGGRLPVLAISRSLNLRSAGAADLQIGFAELPEVKSAAHFEIMRHWLANCDNETHTCRPAAVRGSSSANASTRVPTRLIDVGKDGENIVRLIKTGPNETAAEWMALSHQWGSEPHFFTTTQTINDHLAGMNLEKLPATFKDAVLVTRALGQQYLWIDSLCIIQGRDGDFQNEVKRMEEVYSGAYCVIAASRSTGHFSGFLQKRNTRDHIALRREDQSDAPFYIAQAIDNFKEHVLDSELNRRGWVLQEHALGRRTIFFTEHQTYWECGHGVRCETMTTLSNKSAELLGDPNFPHLLDKEEQGAKITRFQDLYQIYSRLGLTNPYDRPNAIGGLQQRLIRTMDMQGDFGIFESTERKGWLRRSLLWHRGPDTHSLKRINFPPGYISVPSWSWMAYTGEDTKGQDSVGGINYFRPAFDGFDWEELKSPWSGKGVGHPNMLKAKTRQFEWKRGEGVVIFDASTKNDQYKGVCVVLGVQRGVVVSSEKVHYVIVVVPISESNDTSGTSGGVGKKFQRVGAAYLYGKCILGGAEDAEIY